MTLCCFQSYYYPDLSEGAHTVGGKECPFIGVTSSGIVWRQGTRRRDFECDCSTVTASTTLLMLAVILCPLSIIGGSCHKYIFVATNYICRDKNVFVASRHIFCRDQQTNKSCEKTFEMTNICRDKHNFVATRLLSRQNYASIIFVATKDKHVVVATNIHLSRQT